MPSNDTDRQTREIQLADLPQSHTDDLENFDFEGVRYELHVPADIVFDNQDSEESGQPENTP